MFESRHTCEQVTSHMWTSHVTHVNKSHHTSRITLHLRLHSCLLFRRVTQVNGSRHTYEWVMSHVWINRVANQSTFPLAQSLSFWACHTCKWVTSHMQMNHVTRTNKLRHTCECVTLHLWMSHVTYVHESCTHMNTSCHESHYLSTCHVAFFSDVSHVCRVTSHVTSHLWMSHVTTHVWVTLDSWISHPTPINESRHTYE